MIPWTLASLINNTDIVMQGVHLSIIACENKNDEARIQTALKMFDLPHKHDVQIECRDCSTKPFITV